MMNIRHLGGWVVILSLACQGAAEEASTKPIVLWPEGAPGALGSEEIDIPTLTPYPAPPEKATGAAIIVCPDGGYHHLAAALCLPSNKRGQPVAQWLNSIGVAGFVLKYRHLRYKHPAPLQDTAQSAVGTLAIRTVRARAAERKIDPKRIGILGFSPVCRGHTGAPCLDDGHAFCPR